MSGLFVSFRMIVQHGLGFGYVTHVSTWLWWEVRKGMDSKYPYLIDPIGLSECVIVTLIFSLVFISMEKHTSMDYCESHVRTIII